MNWHWASCSIAILALAGTSASPAPRAGNPCKQMRHTLDRQIDDLKVQQRDELQQCELSNGQGSDECLLLKDQQKQVLRAIRDNRTLQMRNCAGGWSFAGPAVPFVVDLNPSCVSNYASEYPEYPDNDKYPPKIRDPHHRHHHPPRQPTETAKAGPVNKATQVSEKSSGKNSHANTLTADSTGRSTASSAGRSYGGRKESAGSHASSSLSSGGGSSLHSSNAGSFGSSASSHSSGAGSGFSGGSSSHSGASSSSSSSTSSSSNSSGGHH